MGSDAPSKESASGAILDYRYEPKLAARRRLARWGIRAIITFAVFTATIWGIRAGQSYLSKLERLAAIDQSLDSLLQLPTTQQEGVARNAALNKEYRQSRGERLIAMCFDTRVYSGARSDVMYVLSTCGVKGFDKQAIAFYESAPASVREDHNEMSRLFECLGEYQTQVSRDFLLARLDDVHLPYLRSDVAFAYTSATKSAPDLRKLRELFAAEKSTMSRIAFAWPLREAGDKSAIAFLQGVIDSYDGEPYVCKKCGETHAHDIDYVKAIAKRALTE